MAAAIADPYIKALNSMPRVILAPIFAVWFGLGVASKVALGVTLVFFIVFFNVYQGVKEVSPVVLANARMLGASRAQLLRHVYLPSATSWVFSSLHTSVGLAFVGAVVGEYLGSSRGVGYLILQAEGAFDINTVMAGILVLTVFALLLDAAVGRHREAPDEWQPAARRDREALTDAARRRDGQGLRHDGGQQPLRQPEHPRASRTRRAACVLRGGLGAAVAACWRRWRGRGSPAAPPAPAARRGPLLGFKSVPVVAGRRAASCPRATARRSIAAWGEPVGVAGDMPGLQARRRQQRRRAGGADGHAPRRHPLLRAGRQPTRGLLVMNHEYTDDGLLHPDGMTDLDAPRRCARRRPRTASR